MGLSLSVFTEGRRFTPHIRGQGVGLSCLAPKFICEALGIRDAINSPTFAIVNEYVGRDADHLIYHFDFYRIRTLAEALDIGTEDYFERPSWSFIEWPERIESLLPPQAVRVHITEQADGARELTISD